MLVSCLPEPHASQRFEQFVLEERLDDKTRTALWRRVMLRSNDCLKNGSREVMDTCDPEPCFCTACKPRRSEDGESRRKGSCVVMVYPDYKHHPHAEDTPEQRAMESVVHRYLVRLGRLPTEFKSPFFRKHRDILEEALEGRMVVSLNSFVSSKEIHDTIAFMAPTSEVMFLIFCGHGAGDRAFVTSNGCALPQKKIGEWLVAARFTGTVICVFNCCHANGVAPTGVPSCGWSPALPFRWVHMYSCGGDESQVTSNAHHVTRVLSRLILERPRYAELQATLDEMWVHERDAGQLPESWRGPPTLKTGGAYDGQFPGPAQAAYPHQL